MALVNYSTNLFVDMVQVHAMTRQGSVSIVWSFLAGYKGVKAAYTHVMVVDMRDWYEFLP